MLDIRCEQGMSLWMTSDTRSSAGCVARVWWTLKIFANWLEVTVFLSFIIIFILFFDLLSACARGFSSIWMSSVYLYFCFATCLLFRVVFIPAPLFFSSSSTVISASSSPMPFLHFLIARFTPSPFPLFFFFATFSSAIYSGSVSTVQTEIRCIVIVLMLSTSRCTPNIDNHVWLADAWITIILCLLR